MPSKNSLFKSVVTLSLMIFMIGQPILARAEILSTAYTRDAVKVTFYDLIDSVTLAIDGKESPVSDITTGDETTVIKYRIPILPDQLRKTLNGKGEHKIASHTITVYIIEKMDGNTDISITATYPSVQADGTETKRNLAIIQAAVEDQDGITIIKITYGTPTSAASTTCGPPPFEYSCPSSPSITVTVIDSDA